MTREERGIANAQQKTKAINAVTVMAGLMCEESAWQVLSPEPHQGAGQKGEKVVIASIGTLIRHR